MGIVNLILRLIGRQKWGINSVKGRTLQHIIPVTVREQQDVPCDPQHATPGLNFEAAWLIFARRIATLVTSGGDA